MADIPFRRPPLAVLNASVRLELDGTWTVSFQERRAGETTWTKSLYMHLCRAEALDLWDVGADKLAAG